MSANILLASQMGEALIRGFINTGVSKPERICASVRSSKSRAIMEDIGVTPYKNALDGGAAEVAQNSDIIFLAVRLPLLCMSTSLERTFLC